MIEAAVTRPRLRTSRRLVLWAALFLLATQVLAAKPPKQLSQVIDAFLNMNQTSLRIEQIIDWRFGGADDSLQLDMDIQGNRSFHVTVPAFGMEIFVTETEMLSLNHIRQQAILESASPTALLDQLFVGGDLSDAKFKKQKITPDGSKQLDFVFSSDFSDWDQLSVILDAAGTLNRIILLDYDGNRYSISLHTLDHFNDFTIPDLATIYPHYQIADLRDTK